MSFPSPNLVASDGQPYQPMDLHGLTAEEALSTILCEKKAKGENAEHQAMVCASLIMSRLIIEDSYERHRNSNKCPGLFWRYLKDLKLPGEVFKSTGIQRSRTIRYCELASWLGDVPEYCRKTKSDEELGIHEGDGDIELGTELQNLQKLLAACFCKPDPAFVFEYGRNMEARHRWILSKRDLEKEFEEKKKEQNARRLWWQEEVRQLLQSEKIHRCVKKRLARDLEPELDVKAFSPSLQLLSPRLKGMLLPVVDEIIDRRNSFDRYLMKCFFTSLWILRFTIVRDFTEDFDTDEIVWYKPTESDMEIIEGFLPEEKDHEQFREETQNIWHCEKEVIRQGLTKEELSFRARLRDQCREAADFERGDMEWEFLEMSRKVLNYASRYFRETNFAKCVADLNIDRRLLSNTERRYPNLWL